MSAIAAATSTAARKDSVSTPGSSAVSATSTSASTPSSTTARIANPNSRREPPHALSGVARSSIAAEHLVATFSVMVDGAVAAHRAGTSADRIVFLGHATVLIELDGVRLLTDPLLRGRVAHLRRQVPPVDASVDRGPRRGADLTPAPRPPRPRLAAAARSRYAAARARRRRRMAAPPGLHGRDRAERR